MSKIIDFFVGEKSKNSENLLQKNQKKKNGKKWKIIKSVKKLNISYKFKRVKKYKKKILRPYATKILNLEVFF